MAPTPRMLWFLASVSSKKLTFQMSATWWNHFFTCCSNLHFNSLEPKKHGHTAIQHYINFFTYRSIFPTYLVLRIPATALCLIHHTPTHTRVRTFELPLRSSFFPPEKSLALALFTEQKRLYSSWVLPGDSHITWLNMGPPPQIIFWFIITICVP